jgi:hypothetical protein
LSRELAGDKMMSKSMTVTAWNEWDGVYRAAFVDVNPDDKVELVFEKFRDWGINDLTLRYKGKELSRHETFQHYGILDSSSDDDKKIEAIYFGRETQRRTCWYNEESQATEYTKERIELLNKEKKMEKK